MKIINLTKANSDNRGDIIDLVTNENIESVTYLTFNPGAVRGNHFHQETLQWNFVISGEILLITQLPGEEKVEKVLKKGDLVLTVKNEYHALKGLTQAELMVFTKGPRSGEHYEKDTYRLDQKLIE